MLTKQQLLKGFNSSNITWGSEDGIILLGDAKVNGSDLKFTISPIYGATNTLPTNYILQLYKGDYLLYDDVASALECVQEIEVLYNNSIGNVLASDTQQIITLFNII